MSFDITTHTVAGIALEQTTIPSLVVASIGVDEVTTPIRHTIPDESSYADIDEVRSVAPFTTHNVKPITNVGTPPKETMPMDKNIPCNMVIAMVGNTPIVG